MERIICAKCGKETEKQAEVAFCPFCGGALGTQPTAKQEPQAVCDLLVQADGMTDIRRKHDLLLQAEKDYPDSLAISQELLHMGRLYERGTKNADFSIIKCFLLMAYLKPSDFPATRRKELLNEIFHHPQLEKCLALAQDRDAFLRAYLLRLSKEFIQLFLRGDSRYMRRIFGIGMDSRASKLLAEPAADILQAISLDEEQAPELRTMLAQQFYEAFSADMSGETTWLDQKLEKLGLSSRMFKA